MGLVDWLVLSCQIHHISPTPLTYLVRPEARAQPTEAPPYPTTTITIVYSRRHRRCRGGSSGDCGLVLRDPAAGAGGVRAGVAIARGVVDAAAAAVLLQEGGGLVLVLILLVPVPLFLRRLATDINIGIAISIGVISHDSGGHGSGRRRQRRGGERAWEHQRRRVGGGALVSDAALLDQHGVRGVLQGQGGLVGDEDAVYTYGCPCVMSKEARDERAGPIHPSRQPTHTPHNHNHLSTHRVRPRRNPTIACRHRCSATGASTAESTSSISTTAASE